MAIKSRENVVGAWAFFIGLMIALVAGLLSSFYKSSVDPVILGVLMILGIIVGYFVAEKDVQTFLLASVSLVIVSYSGISGIILGAAVSGVALGKTLSAILQALLSLFVPATIIVAVKTVFSIAKS